MDLPKYVEYFLEEESIITDQGRTINVIHLIPEDEDAALNEWSDRLRDNYISMDDLDDFRDGWGLSREEYLKAFKFPDSDDRFGKIVMVGDFTEILVADYLQYVLNYIVPRTRYDSKEKRNRSSQGSDLIAYKVQNSDQWNRDDELIVFEIKAQSSENSAKLILQNAVDDSAKDFLRLGESLNASYQRLKDKGKTDDAKIVKRFQNITDRPYQESYGGAAVHSNTSFSIELLQKVDLSKHTDVKLLAVHCEKLLDFIKSMYERAAKC